MSDNPNFTEYILGYVQQDNALGDLARDIQADQGWPADARTRTTYLEYLRNRDASEAAISTFKRAWATFMSERKE